MVKGLVKKNVKNEPYRKYLPARVINDMVKQHKEESLLTPFVFLI